MVKRRYPKRIYPSELRALEKRLKREIRILDKRLGCGKQRCTRKGATWAAKK